MTLAKHGSGNSVKEQLAGFFYYFSPECGFDFENSKTVFLYDTLAHDDAPSI